MKYKKAKSKEIGRNYLVILLVVLTTFSALIYSAIFSPVNAAFSTIIFKGANPATTGGAATSITYTKPAGVEANDIMLIQIVANGASGNIYTPPAGWSLIRRDNTSVLIGDALYYKVAGEFEPTAYTFTFSSSQQASGGIVAYSGVDTQNPIDAHSGSINLNAGPTLTAKPVLTTTPNDMLLFFGAVTSKTSINPPANMTQRWYSTGSTSTSSEMAEQILSTQGDSGSRIGTSGSSSASNIGQLVALRPAISTVITPEPSPTIAPTPVSSDPAEPTTTPDPTPTESLSPAPTPTPTGAVTPQPDITVVAVGDLHCSQSNCKSLQINNLVSQIGPQAFLPIGDLLESGSYSNFMNYYHPTWNPFNPITFPVIGNHEGDGRGYYDYWNGVGVFNGKAGTRGKGWYSYNLGNWHIVALNSNCVSDSNRVSCQPDSEQINWLKADLAANPNKCTLAYMHHPYYSTGSRQYPELKTIFQTLYENKVELYLAGHTHYYQRFYPQDANANRDDVNGVTEIVSGTGGGSLANVGSSTRYKNAAKQIGRNHGVLKFVLKDGSYDFQFVPASGYTQSDSGSGICR
jgi:hypothetical protein